ncbi:MAG: glycosyl hydrolase family 65 protein [Syntrophomonas sp.]|nr:glycosyl hydrolase family 65 protein [Syntrophomonas sp.]
MTDQNGIYRLQNPSLDNYSLLLQETLFHNANGYFGVRSAFEEGYPEGCQSLRGQYINGFYDFTDLEPPERLYGLIDEKQVMLNVIDTQTIKLFIDDEEFSMFTGTVLASSRWVDTVRGITGRQVHWLSPQGREVEITIIRMASFAQLSLFTIDYQVKLLNQAGTVTFQSGHNGMVLNHYDPLEPSRCEQVLYLTPTECELMGDASYITSVTTESGLQVCTSVQNVLTGEEQRHVYMEKNNITCQLSAPAPAGETVRLIKYAVFCDSVRCHDCRQQAALEMEKALAVPLEEWYRSQEDFMANYWDKCLVEIEGDDESNLAVRYSMFQLLQAVSKDRYGNVPAKGLSGERYEGHYFWDTEMYIQPFFTITNPQYTRTLIEYRYRTLPLAVENARLLGHLKGALYPWRTIMGRECSGYYPAGSAQYHINGDIAYSIIAYFLATGDIDLMRDLGAEIIWETARVWMDAGNFHQGQFRIHTVTGPDEYTCMVNNNYYTNVLASYHLEWAAKLYDRLQDEECPAIAHIGLTEEEVAGFRAAAAAMFLPYDTELGINPQDDAFLTKPRWDVASIPRDHFPLMLHYHPLHLYRHQICKQPDTILAHFILEDAQDEQTMHNSYLYYEQITSHDSSLSSSIFSIMAARLGLCDKALGYFQYSAQLDLQDRVRTTVHGINAANLGGIYMAVVYGFGGLRLKESGLYLRPRLPARWLGYRFKICVENTRIAVVVEKDRTTFTRESGEAKKIYIHDTEYWLQDQLVVHRGQR